MIFKTNLRINYLHTILPRIILISVFYIYMYIYIYICIFFVGQVVVMGVECLEVPVYENGGNSDADISGDCDMSSDPDNK